MWKNGKALPVQRQTLYKPENQEGFEMKVRTLASVSVLLTTASAFMLDLLAGQEVNLWLLYVVPIAIGTVAIGYRVGLMLCVLAGALLVESGLLEGYPFSSLLFFLIDRAFCVLDRKSVV